MRRQQAAMSKKTASNFSVGKEGRHAGAAGPCFFERPVHDDGSDAGGPKPARLCGFERDKAKGTDDDNDR